MVVNWDEGGSRSTKQRSTPNVQRRTLNKERRSAGQRIPARRICHSASREAIPIQVACESPTRECLLSLRAVGQAPSGRWPDLYKDRGSHHDASGNSHARRDLVRTLAASQRDRHLVSFLWNERALGCILHH